MYAFPPRKYIALSDNLDNLRFDMSVDPFDDIIQDHSLVLANRYYNPVSIPYSAVYKVRSRVPRKIFVPQRSRDSININIYDKRDKYNDKLLEIIENNERKKKQKKQKAENEASSTLINNTLNPNKSIMTEAIISSTLKPPEPERPLMDNQETGIYFDRPLKPHMQPANKNLDIPQPENIVPQNNISTVNVNNNANANANANISVTGSNVAVANSNKNEDEDEYEEEYEEEKPQYKTPVLGYDYIRPNLPWNADSFNPQNPSANQNQIKIQPIQTFTLPNQKKNIKPPEIPIVERKLR